MRALSLLGTVLLVSAHGALGAPPQKTFASSEEAARQLVAAVKTGDRNAVLAVLGSDAAKLISSGNAASDRQARERFVRASEEGSKVSPTGDGKAVLLVGKNDWPFPFPIVKSASGWRFDTQAGKEEILSRRIGENELSAIQAALAYVDAQREYYLRNPQNDKLLQYAQRIRSTAGKRDGLYYPAKAGDAPSPLGSRYDPQGKTYHGYHYRILKAQGPDAPGGAYSYLAQGRMIGGFALVAYPASYGSSGVMTFIVNQDGAVYERDLGPDSAALARKMTRFNPDKTWKRS